MELHWNLETLRIFEKKLDKTKEWMSERHKWCTWKKRSSVPWIFIGSCIAFLFSVINILLPFPSLSLNLWTHITTSMWYDRILLISQRHTFSCVCVCSRACTQTCSVPPGSSVHGDSPGKNTEVGCHFLLQGIFLTQGLNPRLLLLLHWQADSLPLSQLGNCFF